MTPKEAAKFTAPLQHNPAKVEEFLLGASPREIQEFIHLIDIRTDDRSWRLATIALNIRLAEIAERMTKRIVRLTWFLAILTLALLMVEVRAVFFPKDAAGHPQAVQAGTNQQVVIPPPVAK